MSNIPENLRYAVSHEWISVEGEVGTVGITDHAQQELSDVVYVDLPKVGAQLVAGTTVAVVESVKAASDLYMPIEAEVVEVNSTLESMPELVNQVPYVGGWMLKIRLANPASVDQLLDAAAYQQLT